MGQKVHPIGFRIGVIEDWRSRWMADKKSYSALVQEDAFIRDTIMSLLPKAGISRIEIERKGKAPNDRCEIKIWTSKPGIVIGRKGQTKDKIVEEIKNKVKSEIDIHVYEVRIPELDANIVAQNVAEQIEARVSHKRAMKRAISSTLRAGAKGIKIQVAGRLGGAEMARREWYREGRVPLHTLRAKIDYGFAEAHTKYGRIGVKVWIYLGDVIKGLEEHKTKQAAQKEVETDVATKES
ncbi:MAG: 30S ribosomal protein S3 [Actinobacteria bacterium]|nr:30S ribosomal protein S3 [Actinomycetota bacterium]